MTKNKDQKRRVRARMSKTGESYTAARAQVITGARSEPSAEKERYAELAGMSDAAVLEKTKKSWAEWVRALDAIDAKSLSHTQIARHVRESFEVSAWWAQSVTVGYERIRGLREIGQRRDGGYEAGKSKTFAVPVAELYRAFHDARVRRRWLAAEGLRIRTAQENKSIRMTWSDATHVDLYFTDKGPAKSAVTIAHTKLAAKEEIARVKALWTEHLAALSEHLAPKKKR